MVYGLASPLDAAVSLSPTNQEIQADTPETAKHLFMGSAHRPTLCRFSLALLRYRRATLRWGNALQLDRARESGETRRVPKD